MSQWVSKFPNVVISVVRLLEHSESRQIISSGCTSLVTYQITARLLPQPHRIPFKKVSLPDKTAEQTAQTTLRSKSIAQPTYRGNASGPITLRLGGCEHPLNFLEAQRDIHSRNGPIHDLLNQFHQAYHCHSAKPREYNTKRPYHRRSHSIQRTKLSHIDMLEPDRTVRSLRQTDDDPIENYDSTRGILQNPPPATVGPRARARWSIC